MEEACLPSLHLLHLGVGRGQASAGRSRSGQAGSYPPTPEINPELTEAPLGRPRSQIRSLSCACRPRKPGFRQKEALIAPRPGAPSAGGGTLVQSAGGHSGWTMAPPRNVVKIAVQMSDAIPQLIQLDQVNGTVRTPPPTSGLFLFPRASPAHPSQKSLAPTPYPSALSDNSTFRRSPWPLC